MSRMRNESDPEADKDTEIGGNDRGSILSCVILVPSTSRIEKSVTAYSPIFLQVSASRCLRRKLQIFVLKLS